MPKHVLIIQGHPDSTKQHFCHSLANAYKVGAENGDHSVKEINVAELNFPIIHNKDEFENGLTPKDINTAQEKISWSDHIVIIYPL